MASTGAQKGVIHEIMTALDYGIAKIGEAVFKEFAGIMLEFIIIGGSILLILLALNMMFQKIEISPGVFQKYCIRILIVIILATSWKNFQPIYDVITKQPMEFGAKFLEAAKLTNTNDLYESMDELIEKANAIATKSNKTSKYLGATLVGVFIAIMAAFMAMAAILVMGIAKIILAVMIVLAPVAIAMTLFKPTQPLFDGWLKTTITAAIQPMLVAGVMTIIISIAVSISDDMGTQTITTVGQGLKFIVIILAAAFTMKQIPSFASGIAGGMILGGTGLAEAKGAARSFGGVLAGRGTRKDAGGATNYARNKGSGSNSSQSSNTSHKESVNREFAEFARKEQEKKAKRNNQS